MLIALSHQNRGTKCGLAYRPPSPISVGEGGTTSNEGGLLNSRRAYCGAQGSAVGVANPS